MTLIISVATQDFVVQAGDRLVIDRYGKGGIKASYPQSNKQIVFMSDDAVAVIGFAGAAFLGDLPTDHVIAEALADTEIRYDSGMLGTRGLDPSRGCSLHHYLDRLNPDPPILGR